jgi:hypothetical protein
MKLGKGIPKELPLVCSKKAPTKKELNQTQAISTEQSAKTQRQLQQQGLNKEFVTLFE